jgi:aspartyl-tRNA(Asn)/glutamyl-tRNA(Gln) amidotransferase subunit C
LTRFGNRIFAKLAAKYFLKENENMAIGKEDIANAAVLSRLKLSESAAEEAKLYFENALSVIDKLGELDVSGVPATYPDAVPFSSLRRDAAAPPTPNETLMAGAPDAEDGAYRVPAVVE